MKIIQKCMQKESMRYIFWGFATVGFSYISYWIMQLFIVYQIANLISIILTKIFAYYTNKKFVFRTKTKHREQLLEIVRYIFSRGLSGIVDFAGLILLTEYFLIDDRYGKCIMIVLTTVLNYMLGKFIVFKQNT